MSDEAIITLYSGMCHMDPRVELTDEQSLMIRVKLASLCEPFTGKRLYGTGVLGPDNYMVILKDLEMVVYLTVHGCVTLTQNMTVDEYQDTAHLHEYLSDILSPALQKHVEDYQAQQDAYYENMFRIPKKEKV